MIKVTAVEFAKNFGRYREQAQREPIAITSHGRESCYLISAEHFKQLQRRGREVFTLETAPDDVIDGILGTSMDERHRHLDKLLDE